MNHDFLKNWEPEVVKPKETESTCAGMSSLCKACKNLDEDGVCEIRGFQMDMAPPVYACVEWEAKASMCQGKVEMMRTFTVEVTQILKMGAEAADQAEQTLRKMTEAEIAAGVKAAMGVDDAKVSDVKIFRLDR